VILLEAWGVAVTGKVRAGMSHDKHCFLMAIIEVLRDKMMKKVVRYV
jgi:hypothetical protein